MSRGRHRQSSALLRISVLIAVLAPAFVAVVLAAVGSGAGVLRGAALCAAASAVALVVLLRQSRRNYGEDLARHRRDREHLAATATEIREAHEQAQARMTAQERELVALREQGAATRARLKEAEARAEKSGAKAAVARERVAEADRRVAALQARARQAEERAGQAASRVRELEVRTKELTARTAELDFGHATIAPPPVRLTAELFAGGMAALRGLERSAAAKQAERAKAAEAIVADVKTAEPEAAEVDAEEPVAPTRPAPLAPQAAIPAVRLLRPRSEAVPEADAPVVEPVAEPAAEEPATAAGALPVPRRPAEVAVPAAASVDGRGEELDFGVDALEPAVAALPPDEAVARIVREVANTVRTVNERMSRSGEASSFDFFGRGEAGDADPEARTEPEAEVEPASAAEPEAAPEEAVAETRSHRVVRDASALFQAVSAPPLVTHEPRTGRPIPVDLTAHDDTEQLPKIVDTRKHA